MSSKKVSQAISLTDNFLESLSMGKNDSHKLLNRLTKIRTNLTPQDKQDYALELYRTICCPNDLKNLNKSQILDQMVDMYDIDPHNIDMDTLCEKILDQEQQNCSFSYLFNWTPSPQQRPN